MYVYLSPFELISMVKLTNVNQIPHLIVVVVVDL